MWNIDSLKTNLSKIALDVHLDDDEEEIYGNGVEIGRRNSNIPAHRPPISNGTDSPRNFEIEQLKSEIRRLQESESEIKALSVNYAALLKEKEDHISRLNQENGLLKHNLESNKEALNMRASMNNVKGSGDQSPNRQHKSPLVKNRYSGNQMLNGLGNGIAHANQSDLKSPGKEKELADLLEEKNRSLASLLASHELQIRQLKLELEKGHVKFIDLQHKLEEEQRLKESFQEELKMVKGYKDNSSEDIRKMRRELDEKIREIRRLETELNKVHVQGEDVNENVKNLKRVIVNLEKENTDLKTTKSKLDAALEMSKRSAANRTYQQEKLDSLANSPKKEEMEISLQKLEQELKETRRARDKALQELARLKQHLLQKESEESEKMDEDSKIIEELRQNNEYQKAQILHLEKALKQAMSSQEEVRMITNTEIQKSKDVIEDLNRKLANCMSTIESKNVELLNLQTALGQYFAEIEAKEHVEQQLAMAREESAKLSGFLEDVKREKEASNAEKKEILEKLLNTERMLTEAKNRAKKLEEDNAKLRRAVDQSMTRLNRMSMDSDYLVDRRIVIKLLVTYFQRNHSKEVLDLMVRMLGFSDEDKQRIGIAQHGGRGVVSGVLGLPGRLVGGMLGRSSVDAHEKEASDNQSFADLWVDFLLKETEERERREATEDSQGRSSSNASAGLPMAKQVPSTSDDGTSISRPNYSTRNYSPLPSQGNTQFQNTDSEFSTVSLVDNNTSRVPRFLQKH